MSDEYGPGPGPDDLRRGLLEKFGGFGIRLTGGRDGIAAALRHLREMFGYTPGEALAKFKESKSSGVLGTAVEVETIVQALCRDGYSYETIASAAKDRSCPSFTLKPL
ncbi:hypothetical protein ACFV1W_21000 [Kitasatospora sp. NPDC059648]|uniref:hypothetical protein n=1 Tax=Kitasatospora sp. NPDC059648 TaxID=3346894 RepID=UPI0036A3AEAA